MSRFLALLVLLVTLAVWLIQGTQRSEAVTATPTACLAASPVASPAATPSGAIADQVAFVAALRAKGLRVEEKSTSPQIPFEGATAGARLCLSDGELSALAEVKIQVYQYPDPAAAAADIQEILPNASPVATSILYVEPAHFFKVGRFLVLYVGRDQAVLDLLTEVLGLPFAVCGPEADGCRALAPRSTPVAG